MSQPEQQGWDNDEDEPDNVPSAEIENGHVTSNTEDESETSEEENPTTSREGDFDTDLPTIHKYLGKLDNVRGYTLYDDGQIISILAIYTTTMVFPGFTLPLVINMYMETSILKEFLEKNNVFVLLCANATFNGIHNYGVTMEVFETQERYNVLNIKARGRQRCKLVPNAEIRSLTGRLKRVTVQILAEPKVLTPLCDTQLLSLKQRRLYSSRSYDDVEKNYKFRRYHLAQYPLTSWIYDKNEASYYVKLILDSLAHYVGEYIPEDPIKLSYWFVQNYQLSHEERLHILSLNSALERLKLEYKYLKLDRSMCCNSCGVHITDPSKVFAMSKDGIQSNYVNPGGHVYETVTVTSAQNFKLEGQPSKQFSWFPGYAWTIMQCNSCHNHLGWQFTSNTLRPRCFYGLAKVGYKVVITNRSNSSDEFLELINSRTISFSNDYISIVPI
ncbi:protein cereblon [Diorhabda carinulata]|uniref:protein cereblon n=1 Tax=Diorhabda carinulata TaxID=1163345 RepID=UPI0025A17957|nr:protein cereblon [Diorhabda carinulata]XP_057658365.1 protein cereblon [Diorhabda carinulata]